MCRLWCGLPDDFRKLDSYLIIFFKINHGGYDGALDCVANEMAGGGVSSQTSVDNFNYFLATANSCPNPHFRKLNSVSVETLRFPEF